MTAGGLQCGPTCPDGSLLLASPLNPPPAFFPSGWSQADWCSTVIRSEPRSCTASVSLLCSPVETEGGLMIW